MAEPEIPWEGQRRHVVYLDGRFLDTWTEPVEGSRYESWAARSKGASGVRLRRPNRRHHPGMRADR